MNPQELFEHNRTAYEAVMNHFNEGYQRACVVHATGTGKSYIINAVSDHFERVLIMTTNMFTIDEIQGVINKNSPERTTAPIYKIYQSLLKDMNNDVDYADKFDLVVLDEFHHSGAEQWGKAIEWVIEQNPDAKVLGTSATAIRHSDGMRDMGEELFEGHVLSRLPLGEAWARKALVAPVYIMAVEDSEEFYNDFIKKIEDSNLLEEKKHYYREMASNLKANYEMEKNAAEIIRRWLPTDSRRVIIFSRNIEEAEANKQKVEGWMKKAGFTIAGIYTVHSDKPHEVKEAQMAAFRENDFNGIKLMVAVDMLNEGVHIKGVDAVFFLRKTESPTIFFQQLGRCMVRYEEGCRQPVVFDFRNNVENVNRSSHTRNFFKEAAKDYDNWKELEEESLDSQTIRNTEKEEKLRENFPDGINYTMDYGVMLDRFGEDLSNADWDANYTEAKAFFEKHGHFPRRKENKKIGEWAGDWWRKCYLKNPKGEKVKANKLKEIGFKYISIIDIKNKAFLNYYNEAKTFYIENGRFPTYKEKPQLRSRILVWWKKYALTNIKEAQLLVDIGFSYKSVDSINDEKWFLKYNEANDFYFKYKRWPLENEDKKLRINSWARYWWNNTYLNNPEPNQEKADLLIAIGFNPYKRTDESIRIWFNKYNKAKLYFDKYGHFPKATKNIELYGWARKWWERHYLKNPELNQEKADLLIAIGFEYNNMNNKTNETFLKYYNEAKSFYDIYDRFPRFKENQTISCWARKWWTKVYMKNPKVNQEKADMLIEIGFKYKGKK